jgi:small GTP-binding protein
MGNCNCLSTTNNNKNSETSVEQLVNETKSIPIVSSPSNLNYEKRGASIKTQSFVKQSPTATKKEYQQKNSLIQAENYAGLINNKSFSKFLNRRDINIVIIGESNTGKSSFVIRYVSGKFEPYHVVSVCNEYYDKKGILYNGRKYDFNFTVSAGKSEYKEDILKTCQDVDFFLMFYDVSSKNSFDNLKSLYSDIKNYMFNYKDLHSNVIFIGNKSDIKEKWVTSQEVKDFLQNDKIFVFEISVKNNTNITKVFNQILEIFDATATCASNER